MLMIKVLESCKHFLTDTEMESRRHSVFNFAMSSFDMSLLNDKLDYLFKEVICAAKVNLAFGFVLKNNENGMCRHFYAHVMEISKLVCTQADMTNLKNESRKWILLIFVPEKEPIQSGNFTDLQI